MGRLIKIKSGKYTFYLDGRTIYLVLNSLNQKYIIQTFDYMKLDQYDYAELVDSLYRRKIHNTDTLNQHIISRFRLSSTARELK